MILYCNTKKPNLHRRSTDSNNPLIEYSPPSYGHIIDTTAPRQSLLIKPPNLRFSLPLSHLKKSKFLK